MKGNMAVIASTPTLPPDDEPDRHEMTTEVLATYFVLAAIVLGVILFIGVKKMAQFYFFSNDFDKSNDSEDREYNPHTPVPGLLYQLQVCYVGFIGSSFVQTLIHLNIVECTQGSQPTRKLGKA